ncbi:MAG: hypothetical protein ACYDAL_16290 [Candidatus Dormibacteraceae bacterium]
MSLRIKSEISLGSLLQVAALLATFITFGVRMETKVNAAIADLRTMEEKTDRIEKYLSTKDSHYWETAKRLADPSRAVPE